MSIVVNQCLCRRVAFAELLVTARRRNWALEDLIRETGCGAQCGLCRPYLMRMLQTGDTEFHELLVDDTPLPPRGSGRVG